MQTFGSVVNYESTDQSTSKTYFFFRYFLDNSIGNKNVEYCDRL